MIYIYIYIYIIFTSHKFSCWIATDRGAIWAFVAPVLAIITVRTLLIILIEILLLECLSGEHYYLDFVTSIHL